ncbi:MAG TPA: universal stress protein [Chloroflexota bacterium]|nr:universal stress protein [Chloroflexota bacterium]
MYREILVPLDGSPLAERAIPFAHALALETGARLLLIRAVPPPRFSEWTADHAKIMVDAERYLESTLPFPTDKHSVETAFYFGDPALTIINEAHHHSADVIVMSTHGRSGFGQWIYGSVAEEVFRHVSIPVVIIPSHCQRDWSSSPTRTIVIPLDGSDLSLEAIGPAEDLAQALKASILLARVVPVSAVRKTDSHPETTSVAERQTDLATAADSLEEIARGIRSHGPTVTTTVIESDDPGVAIAELTHATNVAAVAMSTHGRTGVARLSVGSVAARTIQQAECPILLFRPVSMHRSQIMPRLSAARM